MLLNGANEIYHMIPPCPLSAKSGQLHYSYSVRLELDEKHSNDLLSHSEVVSSIWQVSDLGGLYYFKTQFYS